MKRVVKILSITISAVMILISLLLIYLKTMLPDVSPAYNIKVDMSEPNVNRGRYLSNHVMLCIDCHSTRDWTMFSGPLIPGTEGKGGEVFDQKLGFPGKYISPNITPFSLKNWTDGEVIRAITAGVSKNGRALFSIMPYHNFGQLDIKDIESVVAYLRTLKPIENALENSSSDFPMNFIINTIPKNNTFSKIPQITDTINYGKYMITAAGCKDCHTKQVKGKFVGELYAGGFEFLLQDGSIVRSSNLTSDPITGLGNWTRHQFVRRFKMYTDSSYKISKLSEGEFQTVMPWTRYSGLSEADLLAMFSYLRSLPPAYNVVEKFMPAAQIHR